MNRNRNHLPVVANPVTQMQHDREAYLRWFFVKAGLFIMFGSLSMWQFSKAYYPMGIILRNSIPQTMA